MSNFPASWTTQLSDFVTYVGTPTGTIYWNEAVDSQGLYSARHSINSAGQSTMTFWTGWDTIQNNYQVMVQSVLGGYSSVNTQRNPPMVHPYLPKQFATDIAGIQQVCVDGSSADDGLGDYVAALVTVNFQDLPYTAGSGSDGSKAPNWLTTTARGTNNRLSVPLGWYSFQSGTFSGFPAQFGTFYNQGLEFIDVTFRQVPAAKVFSSGSLYSVANYFGSVNSDTFLGYPAGSILCDSADNGLGYTNGFDTMLFDFTMHFIYTGGTGSFPPAWNKALGPDGNWYPIGLVVSGTPPFPTQAFAGILTALGF